MDLGKLQKVVVKGQAGSHLPQPDCVCVCSTGACPGDLILIISADPSSSGASKDLCLHLLWSKHFVYGSRLQQICLNPRGMFTSIQERVDASELAHSYRRH